MLKVKPNSQTSVLPIIFNFWFFNIVNSSMLNTHLKSVIGVTFILNAYQELQWDHASYIFHEILKI